MNINSSCNIAPFLFNFILLTPIQLRLNSFIHSLRKHILEIKNSIHHVIQTRLRSRLQLHYYGYCYAPIFCNRLIELLILQWPIGSESKPHSHGAAINFTKVLSGQMLERKYHVSGGQLRLISERIVGAGQWAWTLPFEIHELIALNSSAETMHLYFPGRKG